jgi:transcription initiation factor IIE alpha subunit
MPMPNQPRLIQEDPAAYQTNSAEKDAYRERLRQYLQDPAFRQIEGFPIGADEDILALSDPPCYTACPNPFLPELITQWQAEREQLRAELGLPNDQQPATSDQQPTYHREPFAADVSEGKNDPIYNAHSYHTKVPHKAIMRYILHYTDPGDIVFDGFCGTGMTGVAAQLCGDRHAVEELGYFVDEQGYIYDASSEIRNPQSAISRLGARKAILNDLSPAATFIAYNYNTPVDVRAFEWEAQRILREVEEELGWMYETWHPHCDAPNRMKAKINYTVWSEVFACPHCGAEIVFYDAAVNKDSFRVNDSFACPDCQATLEKRSLERIWQTSYDVAIQQTQSLVKFTPVLINYQFGEHRLEKKPDAEDLATIERVENLPFSNWYPVYEMPEGERKGKDGYHLKGITHLHHFYFRRALLTYADLWWRLSKNGSAVAFTRFYAQGSCLGFTKMNRYSANHYSQVNRYFSGTLFVGSLISEVSPAYSMTNKRKRLAKLKMPGHNGGATVTCQSTTGLSQIADNSFDYVFVDPPFGNNLHYSELNFFWEAWLKILTERQPEAVMDKGRDRTLIDYQALMTAAFQEIFRILKPGRWMTVEFHNSQNRVWNAIQEAMLRAGFVIADVRTLDKQQETYKQSIQGLVKADLVISAYKPDTEFEERFLKEAGSEEGAWEFIRQHLAQLPIVVSQEGVIETLSERQDYLLFDRMVAFHIQRGASVPLSAGEFYAGLRQRFIERDSMFFLSEQVPEYDKARLSADSVAQLSLFVSDEKSSIQWLRQQLAAEFGGYPQTYQEIQPQFLRQLHQLPHESLPELTDLLEQNFLQDEQGRWYMPDPNKATDLEKLRQKALLREFASYLEGKKKLKLFRTEAVRAGFAQAWRNKEYATIVQVADRLPETVLQEDPDLLMYYDNASLLA